jgi:hypothetical protein
MYNEAYARAVLAERARERDTAIRIRHRQLLASEPEPARAPRPVRLRFFGLARRLRIRRADAYVVESA